jgi:hypothetical protein
MSLPTKKHAILQMLTKIARDHSDKKLFHLPANEVKRLCGYIYILSDVELSLNTTKCLKDMISQRDRTEEFDSNGVYEVMWYGIIITYSRCFTQSKGRLTTLSKEIFEDAPDIALIHNKILDIRNTFVAHRDDTEMLISTITLAVASDGIHSYIFEAQRTRFLESDLDNYITLFEFLIPILNAKIEREKSKIAKFLNSLNRAQVEKMQLAISIREMIDDLIGSNQTIDK